MANADRPSGFRPYGRVLRCTRYIAGAAVYPGDVVHMEDDGKVDPATASEAAIGVAASYASGDGQEVLVWDDPDQRFVAQLDNGTSLAQTAVGLNFNIVATAGNSSYKQSRMEVDSSSAATNSTLPLRLAGFSRQIDKDANIEFGEVVVSINNHQLAQPSVGL